MKIAPELPRMVRENREMLTRAVSWAGAQGIAQVIDLGCGMPAEPGIHVTARAGVPGGKVACIDNDPVVINHLTALLGKDMASVVIDSDVTDSGGILARAGKLIDLSRPACLVMGALVHFYEKGAARDLVASYVSALAQGSYVVLSVGCIRPGPDAEEIVAVYSSGPNPLYVHSAEDIVSFLDGLEILPPGVADARVWRPGWDAVPDPAPRSVWMNCVMARIHGI